MNKPQKLCSSPQASKNYQLTANNSTSYETSEENDEVIVFRPIKREQMRPSPVEIAVNEERKIAFYIPSEEFQESALFVLDWAIKRLRKKKPSISTPEYEFIVGKQAPDWDGKLDEDGRIIISHAGAARFG